MTNPMRQTPGLPTPPKGWPVGSYDTYAQAQRAVDHLSDNEFAVENLTIVGVDLMQVERVLGRLTWSKVIVGGLGSGAWLGAFFGMLMTLVAGSTWMPILIGVGAGMVFGLITTVVPYALTRGQRDFTSTMQLVAGRYDVLCDPRAAEKARDMLARLAI